MPWESIQLDSSNKTYAIRKKNTHLLLAFEELDIETDVSLGFKITEILSLVL